MMTSITATATITKTFLRTLLHFVETNSAMDPYSPYLLIRINFPCHLLCFLYANTAVGQKCKAYPYTAKQYIYLFIL